MALENIKDSILQGIDIANIITDKATFAAGIIASSNASDIGDILEKISEAKLSMLGTVVLDHVTFFFDKSKLAGANKDLNQVQISPIQRQLDAVWNGKVNATAESFQLYSVTLDHVFITVNRSKNIVKTVLPNSNSTIKQFICNDDYSISFTGIIAGSNAWQTDTLKIKKLNALFQLGTEIKVDSIYLNNLFQISDIILENMSFDQDKKYGNLVNYSFSATSDDPESYLKGYNSFDTDFVPIMIK